MCSAGLSAQPGEALPGCSLRELEAPRLPGCLFAEQHRAPTRDTRSSFTSFSRPSHSACVRVACARARTRVCMCMRVRACACVRVLGRFIRVQLSVTPCAAARQAPLSLGFSRQGYWSGLPCPPLGHHPDPGMEPPCTSHRLHCRRALYDQRRLGCGSLPNLRSLSLHLQEKGIPLKNPAKGTSRLFLSFSLSFFKHL